MHSPSLATEILKPELRQAPAHTTGSRLVLNALSNFLGQAVVLLLTFCSTPYITRKLGAAQYGALSLLMVYLFSFSLLNLGINTSLVKYLAELSPRTRLREMQSYLSTALTVLPGIGLLIGATVFSLAPVIVRHLFKGPGELTGPATSALRIASMAFVLQFLCQVLSAVPAAVQRFDLLNVVRTGSDALRILGCVAVLYFGHALPALLTVVLLASVCAVLGYSVTIRRLVPGLRLTPGFSRRHFRSLIDHSRFVLVGNASNQIVSTADSFLLGYFLPVSSLAYYGIAYTVPQRLWGLVANVTSVVFPAASAFSGAGERAQLTELYLRGTKITAAAALFPCLALSIFSHDFLLFWVGRDYAEHGSLVMSLLALGFLLNSFTQVPYQMLQSTHYASTAAKGAMVYTLISLGAFCLLIPLFGLLGAAAGFLGAQLVFVPWFVHRTNRLLGIRWQTVITRSYSRVFITALVGCLVSYLNKFYVHSLFTLGLAVAAGLVIYALLGSVIVLDARERATCRSLVERALLFIRRTG